jgi:hypothetical protein
LILRCIYSGLCQNPTASFSVEYEVRRSMMARSSPIPTIEPAFVRLNFAAGEEYIALLHSNLAKKKSNKEEYVLHYLTEEFCRSISRLTLLQPRSNPIDSRIFTPDQQASFSIRFELLHNRTFVTLSFADDKEHGVRYWF